MKSNRSGALIGGVVLVILGVLLLLARLTRWGDWGGWQNLWPVFVVGFGLLFLVSYFSGGMKDGGLAFLATGLILTGLFFFGFTLKSGPWGWGQMSRLWPVFPLIWGLAFVVDFLAERRKKRDLGGLGFGLVAMAFGGIALGVTQFGLSKSVADFWPLLIVALGLFGLLTGVAQAVRRK